MRIATSQPNFTAHFPLHTNVPGPHCSQAVIILDVSKTRYNFFTSFMEIFLMQPKHCHHPLKDTPSRFTYWKKTLIRLSINLQRPLELKK